MSNQPLILPRPHSSTTPVDQSVHYDKYTRRSSNNSSSSNELPKLSMFGAYGHPARLGGPSSGMHMRSPGPLHWHGFSGSRM